MPRGTGLRGCGEVVDAHVPRLAWILRDVGNPITRYRLPIWRHSTDRGAVSPATRIKAISSTPALPPPMNANRIHQAEIMEIFPLNGLLPIRYLRECSTRRECSEDRFSRFVISIGSMKALRRKRSRSTFRVVLSKVSLSSRSSDIPRVGDGRDSILVVRDFAE